MERRAWLRQMLGYAVLAALSSLPFGIGRLLVTSRQEQRHAQKLRLPGASKDKRKFAAACIGCGLCAQVCPPKAIVFSKSDDGAWQQLPYIDPQQTGCILCGKCMEVCPTEALTVTPLRKIDMGRAKITRNVCYPWVDRGICGACVSICPLGDSAIGFKQGNIYRPYVKAGCVGCGLCVEVCPHPYKPIRIIEREVTSVKNGNTNAG